jgi:hypothetical protein
VKSPLLLLGFCLLAPGLFALAPHPSVLTVKYNDQMLPVVRVDGTDPYVVVDGKEKMVRSEPIYLLQDADGFCDNFVNTPRGALAGRMKMELLGENTYDPSAQHSGGTYVEFPLTATKTIKHGFAALLLYAPDTYTAKPGSVLPTEIIVHELPELPAGKMVRVKFSARELPRTTEPMFFIQIFDETGREVMTPNMQQAWEYYTSRDRVRFARAVEKYQEKFKGADHDAVPIFTPKPIFKSTAVLPTGEVTVVLTIEPEGNVSYVDAGMVADDGARESLTEALGGWYFLPKLKAGEPVSIRINVPLQF